MRIRKAAVLALSFALMLSAGAMSVFAAGYELTVYSGNGEFASGDSIKGTKVSVDEAAATVSVDGGSAEAITMPDGESADNSKYFVRGVKVTGHDNSEVIVDDIDLASSSSPVKNKDAAYLLNANGETTISGERVCMRNVTSYADLQEAGVAQRHHDAAADLR